MKKYLFAISVLALAVNANASEVCTENCSSQHIGDISESNDGSSSWSSQVNPSSNSNQSGNSIDADQRLQQSGNTVDQSGNKVSSTATGGSALGNQSSNTNTTSANSGGNKVSGSNDTSIGNVSSNSGGNKLGQGQEQGQGQSQSSKVSGGNTRVDASDRSRTSIDASDRSNHSYTDNSKYIHIPTVTQPTIPVVQGVSNIVSSSTACSPLQWVERDAVYGTYNGFFKTRKVFLGFDDSIHPLVAENGLPQYYYEHITPDGRKVTVGHHVISKTAILGVSGSRNFQLGGGGSQGSWGQAGGGASSNMQRLVTHYEVVLCEKDAYTAVSLPMVKDAR